jgi:sec-independent protein translocase protein TatC
MEQSGESRPAETTPQTRRRRLRLGRPRWLRFPHFRRKKEERAELKTLTLVEHLVELRNRILISALSVIPGTVLGFIFAPQIIEILKRPLPTDDPLIVLGLTDALMIDLKIALTTGVIVAMPVVLYQLWRYISPGLTPGERAAARPWVPLALLFFALGISVAYLVLPVASGFLYGFQSKDIQLMLTADAYFSFVTSLFLAFGLVMEFPILLVLLSKVGILSSQRLRRSRRTALLIVTVTSAMITPGGDLISPLAMAATMYGLYEVSIIMIRLNGR